MILQTLLVSKDDLSAEALIKVLVQFGVVVDRSSAVDVALARLSEERFDQVIVDFDGDFDDPETAKQLLEACCRVSGCEHHPPVTVALLHDASQIRSILGAGAHFILTKPIEQPQAPNTFPRLRHCSNANGGNRRGSRCRRRFRFVSARAALPKVRSWRAFCST